MSEEEKLIVKDELEEAYEQERKLLIRYFHAISKALNKTVSSYERRYAPSKVLSYRMFHHIQMLHNKTDHPFKLKLAWACYKNTPWAYGLSIRLQEAIMNTEGFRATSRTFLRKMGGGRSDVEYFIDETLMLKNRHLAPQALPAELQEIVNEIIEQVLCRSDKGYFGYLKQILGKERV